MAELKAKQEPERRELAEKSERVLLSRFREMTASQEDKDELGWIVLTRTASGDRDGP